MIFGRSDGTRAADARLVLPFETRCRSRFRASLENGETVGVMVARGTVLRGGDLLLAEDGRVIEVRAALESVSTAMTDDSRLLTRVAYHLGNRHVPVELGAGWLRYGHDHVLDDMVLGLGLRVMVSELPFEPEAGAYHSHAAAHDHGSGSTPLEGPHAQRGSHRH